MRAAAVIVQYGDVDSTVRCLESLVAAGWGRCSDLIVVDNPSSTETAAALERRLGDTPWGSAVRILPQRTNGGYGAACNAGARALGGAAQWILFLNADVRWQLPLSQWIQLLESQPPSVGVVGLRMQRPAGVPPASPFLFPDFRAEVAGALAWGPLVRRWLERRRPDPQRSDAVDWVSGSALGVRAMAWEQAGGFDPRYFLYFEEVDLCRRLRNLGWSARYEARWSFFHRGGGSTGLHWGSPQRRPAYWFQSRARYLDTHHGPLGRWGWSLGWGLLRGIRLALRGPVSGDPPRLLSDFFRYSFLPLDRSPWSGARAECAGGRRWILGGGPQVGDWLRRQPAPGWIVTANWRHLFLAAVSGSYARRILSADGFTLDGFALHACCGFFHKSLRRAPRLTGAALVNHWLGAPGSGRVLVVGGRRDPRPRAQTSVEWVADLPTAPAAAVRELVRRVRRYRPDIVLLGLGSPRQDHLAWALRRRVPLVVAVGSALDFFTGAQRRAPERWRRHNVEWLWRLKEAPLRLMPRYFVEYPLGLLLLPLLGWRSRRLRRASLGGAVHG